MHNEDMAICLWYDNQAEEAANFYVSIFKNSNIEQVNRFGSEGYEFHGKEEGSVLSVDFVINGLKIVAVNGNSRFSFNESVSITVYCETQEEIDYFWSEMTKDGGETSSCGWLKDKFGVSWQIVPRILKTYLIDSNPDRKKRVEQCLYKMVKLDIDILGQAYRGE